MKNMYIVQAWWTLTAVYDIFVNIVIGKHRGRPILMADLHKMTLDRSYSLPMGIPI